ncbi:MAG: hypothetical protein KME13_11540 [Myxacorys californica WJT36-NPBG1]|jgi:hypothetical protein|nr:hypothetical protein [Myxacorys californica WJT36-NPBG1]
MLVPDAETILDAADLARDAGFINGSDRPLIAVIFFALLCLGVWWGDRQKDLGTLNPVPHLGVNRTRLHNELPAP